MLHISKFSKYTMYTYIHSLFTSYIRVQMFHLSSKYTLFTCVTYTHNMHSYNVNQTFTIYTDMLLQGLCNALILWNTFIIVHIHYLHKHTLIYTNIHYHTLNYTNIHSFTPIYTIIHKHTLFYTNLLFYSNTIPSQRHIILYHIHIHTITHAITHTHKQSHIHMSYKFKHITVG